MLCKFAIRKNSRQLSELGDNSASATVWLDLVAAVWTWGQVLDGSSDEETYKKMNDTLRTCERNATTTPSATFLFASWLEVQIQSPIDLCWSHATPAGEMASGDAKLLPHHTRVGGCGKHHYDIAGQALSQNGRPSPSLLSYMKTFDFHSTTRSGLVNEMPPPPHQQHSFLRVGWRCKSNHP